MSFKVWNWLYQIPSANLILREVKEEQIETFSKAFSLTNIFYKSIMIKK